MPCSPHGSSGSVYQPQKGTQTLEAATKKWIGLKIACKEKKNNKLSNFSKESNITSLKQTPKCPLNGESPPSLWSLQPPGLAHSLA